MPTDRNGSTTLGLQGLFEHALKALARRPHTTAELRTKLSSRCAEQRDVDDVLERLRQYRYVDDGHVAESYSEFRRDYAGFGRRRVLNELIRRGVERDTAERAVSDAYRNTDEVALARAFLRRKLGAPLEEVRIDGRRQMARLIGALSRAGFGPGTTREALAGLDADPELVDALSEVLENA